MIVLDKQTHEIVKYKSSAQTDINELLVEKKDSQAFFTDKHYNKFKSPLTLDKIKINADVHNEKTITVSEMSNLVDEENMESEEYIDKIL